MQLWFVTWEDALAEIGNGQLGEFYQLCQRFNRSSPTAEVST